MGLTDLTRRVPLLLETVYTVENRELAHVVVIASTLFVTG